MRFNVLLDFLFQRLGPFGSGGKHNTRLNDLTTDFIRGGGYAAFEYIRQFHNHVLNFKRPDAIAGALDHIVLPADIPVVPVLIPPGKIAGMIKAVLHRLVRLLFVR